ncbi:rhodanese-like domain-containing protein [Calothrix sp. FACHB-1219]|uniref:rhodanese-like domain-containing protein n=1 Tax=unclassified Calothrix TaxID=2619626 RepID=UPI0016838C9B|nr:MULTISPECIES: rhodanese-like domain-containing protein [unclassified Calothrix]MBD2206823.1 rhodanese-like domain-containing protein [Calothrix sp. FACHB-168]MBD2219494.1 rhodanese-like domain-containing protein [Calothrix sp. FACHB-1219]
MSNTLATDAHDLKLRLEWGHPALTIIDVRDRLTYNQGHISGAIPIPLSELAQRAKTSLHTERHIYVYGSDDQQSANATQALKAAGFAEVSAILGGLAGWKAAGGATEGPAA